jgi:hypothetical protein
VPPAARSALAIAGASIQVPTTFFTSCEGRVPACSGRLRDQWFAAEETEVDRPGIDILTWRSGRLAGTARGSEMGASIGASAYAWWQIRSAPSQR